MKKTIKGFILGLIIATLLMSTVLGAGVKKTIDVAFNSVNLTVNGKKVGADNILYNGTTYVPLRAAAEALDKEVGWDGNTNTASINDKELQESEKPKEEPKKLPIQEKVTNANELKNYLKDNFSNIKTVIGDTSFDFNVIENSITFLPEDYKINVLYSYDYFEGAKYSNKYTTEEKQQLKKQLKDHMEKIGKAAIKVMPNKKLTGSYYSFYYKYPSIKEGYTSSNYYTWISYNEPEINDLNVYEKTKLSEFQWYNRFDDEL